MRRIPWLMRFVIKDHDLFPGHRKGPPDAKQKCLSKLEEYLTKEHRWMRLQDPDLRRPGIFLGILSLIYDI